MVVYGMEEVYVRRTSFSGFFDYRFSTGLRYALPRLFALFWEDMRGLANEQSGGKILSWMVLTRLWHYPSVPFVDLDIAGSNPVSHP
jgi:hypothetical protein